MTIENEEQYENALNEFEFQTSAPMGEAERIVTLRDAIAAYEDIHYPIEPCKP